MLSDTSTYNGHAMCKTPGSEATSGWWFVPDLSLHLKVHQRWRAEVWSLSDGLHLGRLRIYDHRSGAEWLDAFYPLGTCGAVPFQRADRFMLDGQMPGWGEWPSEPTSSGRVPTPACVYCHGPISHTEVLVIAPGPPLGPLCSDLGAWAPCAHHSCHQAQQQAKPGPGEA